MLRIHYHRGGLLFVNVCKVELDSGGESKRVYAGNLGM
jgi:hypothetical protein